MAKLQLADLVVDSVQVLSLIHLSKGEDRDMKTRLTHGLIYAHSGSLQYFHNGRQFRSDPSHVLFVPGGLSYSLVSEEDSDSTVINFTATEPLEADTIASLFIGNSTSFSNAFARLDNLWTFKKAAYHHRCLAALYDILARLEELEEQPYAPELRYDQIKPSIAYLEAHYSDPSLNNDILAAKSNISTVYFRKLFTEKYGVPPMKYVKTKRIEKAEDLLKSRYYTAVTDVAEAVGFSTIYHFSRAFKKETGHSPSDYMRQYGDDEPEPMA